MKETLVTITTCLNRDFVSIIFKGRNGLVRSYQRKQEALSHLRVLKFINDGNAKRLVVLPECLMFYLERS